MQTYTLLWCKQATQIQSAVCSLAEHSIGCKACKGCCRASSAWVSCLLTEPSILTQLGKDCEPGWGAGKYLESMGLLNERIWDCIRGEKPPFMERGLLAFLQMVAEGLSYQAMPSSQAEEGCWVDCLPGTTL